MSILGFPFRTSNGWCKFEFLMHLLPNAWLMLPFVACFCSFFLELNFSNETGEALFTLTFNLEVNVSWSILPFFCRGQHKGTPLLCWMPLGLSDGCIFVVVGSTIVTCSLCWHLAFVLKFFPFKVFCVICTSFICPYNKLTLREPVNDVYGLYMMYKARNHVPIPCLFWLTFKQLVALSYFWR